jgi:hypothetical protein
VAGICLTPLSTRRFELRVTAEGRYRFNHFDTSMANDTYVESIGSGGSIALLLGVALPLNREASK